MRNVVIASLTSIVLIASACGNDPDETGSATAPGNGASATETASEPDAGPTSEAATEPTESAAAGATLHVVTTELGDVLADEEGRTLYAFLPDDRSASTCYDDCEQNWPPLIGPADAGAGVDATLIATAQREDGSEQVTYNQWPLYYFANDEQPGDLNGQGVGGVWFIVNVDGQPVQPPAAGGDTGYGY